MSAPENLTAPEEKSILANDWNDYSDRKSYAKGLVDIALLTANANQFKHSLAIEDLTYRVVNITLVSLSIVLQVRSANNDELLLFKDVYFFQVVAGILLILDHRIKVTTKEHMKVVTRYTLAIQILMFCIIIINVLIVALEPGPKN